MLRRIGAWTWNFGKKWITRFQTGDEDTRFKMVLIAFAVVAFSSIFIIFVGIPYLEWLCLIIWRLFLRVLNAFVTFEIGLLFIGLLASGFHLARTVNFIKAVNVFVINLLTKLFKGKLIKEEKKKDDSH